MKNRKMSIRISDEDWQKIHERADHAGMNLTEFVTTCCLEQKIVTINGLEEVIRQQKGIGRNLNQLTTLANMGRVQAVHLEELASAYSGVNDSLAALLRKKV